MALTEDATTEHVWLEPVRWANPGIEGILAVDRANLPSYKRGDLIRPVPDKISGWVILDEDGDQRGGFTIEVIERRQEAQ